jgi:tRNA (mo5U34)-methyltransferase
MNPETLTSDQLRDMQKALGYWFHSIELGQGVFTNGIKTRQHLARETQNLRLPDLRGKTVLDVGAIDGYYSFEAERRGAKRVLALDCLAWEVEIGCNPEYEKKCREQGIEPHPFADPRNTIWRSSREELLGKRRFDLARRALGSNVESVFADFMSVDLEELGAFDVVFFFGVLYHLENPLEAVRRLAAITKEVAIIETEAVVLPGLEHHAVCEFYESDELNADASNWWAPNEKALLGMCRAAGFRRVETIVGPPLSRHGSTSGSGNPVSAQKPGFWKALRRSLNGTETLPTRNEISHYRMIVHAWK